MEFLFEFEYDEVQFLRENSETNFISHHFS